MNNEKETTKKLLIMLAVSMEDGQIDPTIISSFLTPLSSALKERGQSMGLQLEGFTVERLTLPPLDTPSNTSQSLDESQCLNVMTASQNLLSSLKALVGTISDGSKEFIPEILSTELEEAIRLFEESTVQS